MKKNYEAPMAELIRFSTEDILAASGPFVEKGEQNANITATEKSTISWGGSLN